MTKTFTPNDVLRYVYDEISNKEKKAIENALSCNSDLLDFYLTTIEARNNARPVMKEPSDKSIENILNYSRSFQVSSNV